MHLFRQRVYFRTAILYSVTENTNFAEAYGIGAQVKKWMKPIFTFVVPVGILLLWLYGIVTFQWN